VLQEHQSDQFAHYQIIRRNGAVVSFEPNKIAVAMMKAFLAVHGTQGAASASVRETVDALTQAVARALMRSRPGGGTFHIEDVQDQVELGLMRGGHHEIARAYVLYREKRSQERAKKAQLQTPAQPVLHVMDGGQRVALDMDRLRALIDNACVGLGSDVSAAPILAETLRNLYDGVPLAEVHKASILAARTLIEKDPDYTYVTARLLFHTIAREVLGRDVVSQDMPEAYVDYFPHFIKRGVQHELLDERLLQYDLKRLAQALNAGRDLQFDYLGLQTLYDRYFLHVGKARIELPQAFFMRVAMGLALNEIDREARAIEFYEVLSSFDFMSSTPTLFNSGTLRSQLSSCYLTTVPDDLDGIYESIKENALLSKFAGGLGNDWTRVRALGSHIKGTNGESQGVVPFLKVVNDTAVAVNQGGKRKGAVCTYLETWHLDIEEFLELRKNTGDDRRRTHDMNTANWIPDLFMRRVMEKGSWTLFSPNNVPDLHDLFGSEFERAYVAYEEKAVRGEISPSKTVPAADLWRKMLTMLFETGHPWITFKDACNVRSPQQHVGVVHSSNLCTEITLNTSDTETAVCNLGSVNLLRHLKDGQLDHVKLQKTISTLTITPSRKHAIQICAIGLLGWASWPSKTVFTNCAFRMPAKRRCSLLTSRWRPFATTPTRHRLSWPASAVDTPAIKVPCGTKACCLWTPWTCWPRRAAAMLRWIGQFGWTGMPCAARLPSMACATPTALPSHRRPPSLTSLVSMLPLSPVLAIFR
jgi:ribonucleoside-diphosphate reductase alpha chain